MQLRPKNRNRWIFLLAAIGSMSVVSLYQYSWTLFVFSIGDTFKVDLPAVQLTFTIFVWVSTWFQPLAGMIADRQGPLRINIIGALCAGFGWILSGFAQTIWVLYLTYALGSIGVAIFYGISISTAVKWFPDK